MKKKTKEIFSDEEYLAKEFLKNNKRNSNKTSTKKDVEYYRISMLQGIESRCGKKRGYKNIKNLFTKESYTIWFDNNINVINSLLKKGLIPSVERVNSKDHYSEKNCIIIPNNLNGTLGRIHSLENQLLRFKKFVENNLNYIPEHLHQYYRNEYLRNM